MCGELLSEAAQTQNWLRQEATPAGRPCMLGWCSSGWLVRRVKLHTADASPDNGFTFYLVNPSGNLVATATTLKTVNGKSAATADLYTLHPVPGPWQIDVVLNLAVSGKEFTQTVVGALLIHNRAAQAEVTPP